MSNFKLIVTYGDSWTSGDMVCPKLEEVGITDVNNPMNNEYRLSKVWPYKLQKISNIQCINYGEAGASNDGIVKNVLGTMPKILDDYNPDEVLVIVGWTSPERRDFFYKDENSLPIEREWETIYPAELEIEHPIKNLNEFKKLYTLYFWHKEEYIVRYMLSNLHISNFLKANNINYLFFDAFYEEYSALVDPNKHGILGSSCTLYDIIKNDFISFRGDDNDDVIRELFLNLYDSNFIHETFKEFIVRETNEKQCVMFDKYHPNELAHELWAKKIYENEIRNRYI